jgi:hypothetical protein
MNTFSGPLPRHQYVWVDTTFTHKAPCGFVPAVWFALTSWPSRAWGCTVLLESGACYRNLPPHALAYRPDPEPHWPIQAAQRWDCYGWGWAANLYPYLEGVDVTVRSDDQEHEGEYLFSVAPVGDAFSAAPDQGKEFTFVKLDNGRLTIQPTDYVLFREKSFTSVEGWPQGMKRSSEVWSCE